MCFTEELDEYSQQQTEQSNTKESFIIVLVR